MARTDQFRLQTHDGRHVRFIGEVECAEMVSDGRAKWFFESRHGHSQRCLGVRMTKPQARPSSSNPSPAQITTREMRVNALQKLAHKLGTGEIFAGAKSAAAKIRQFEKFPSWQYRGRLLGYGVTR